MAFVSRPLAFLGSLQRRLGLGLEAKARQSLTLVSTGCSLNGIVDTPGSLRVEGRLEGDARVQGSVEVLKGAAIIGTVLHCKDLLIAGLVEAQVVAEGSVTVVSGGCLRGNLTCRALQVANGAELRGQVLLGEDATTLSLPSPAARMPLPAIAGARSLASHDT